MGHYMTKEGVEIICKNCLYWGNTSRLFNGVYRSCGNANQRQDYTRGYKEDTRSPRRHFGRAVEQNISYYQDEEIEIDI